MLKFGDVSNDLASAGRSAPRDLQLTPKDLQLTPKVPPQSTPPKYPPRVPPRMVTRDLSQRLGNGRAMLVGRFSRPGDHSRSISAHFGDFGPNPLSETSTSALSQQQTSVLSQQQTSVLSQQETSVLSQQKTSILSQQQTFGPEPAEFWPGTRGILARNPDDGSSANSLKLWLMS